MHHAHVNFVMEKPMRMRKPSPLKIAPHSPRVFKQIYGHFHLGVWAGKSCS